DTFSSASLGMGVGALLMLPIGMLVQGEALLNVSLWPQALGVAVLSSAVPYSLELVAMARMSGHTFGIMMSLEPAVAALCGHLLLGETLGATQLGAIACIMIACAGNALSRAHAARSKTPRATGLL
ncbi:MAG: EamA family transporter, partial [Deltaproteobacteria bacterium]